MVETETRRKLKMRKTKRREEVMKMSEGEKY